MGLGGISVHQEQHVSPWSFQEILAKQQASSTGGTRSPDRQAGLSPPSGLDGQCTPGEYPDLSSIPHTGSPSPTLPPLRAPPPPAPLPFGCAGSRRQCPGLAGLAQEGLRPHPTQLSTLQLSLPLQAHHLAGVANSHPSPVQQARLKFHRSSAFPGVGSSPGSREVGVFTSHGSKCCWLQHPLSSHGFWQGMVTATTGPWQILAGEGGWPIVCFYSSPFAL